MANKAFARLSDTGDTDQPTTPSRYFESRYNDYRAHDRPPQNSEYDDYVTQNHRNTSAGIAHSPQPWRTSYQPVNQYQGSERFETPSASTPKNFSNFSRRLSSISSGTARILSPLLAKPWHHEHVHYNHNESTVKNFSKSAQTRRILLHGLVQWLPVAIFSACIACVFYFYAENHEYVTHHQKYRFNSLVLGCTLLLAFSVQAGFKLYADLMRWKFLTLRYWDLQTFEQIMGCASQRTVLRLLWRARKRSFCVPSRIQSVCLIYFLICIGLQVVIACLGLCYSVEQSDTVLGSRWGSIAVANLHYISLERNEPVAPDDTARHRYVLQGGAANAYGTISTMYSTLTDVLPEDRTQPNSVYNSTTEPGYEYQFFDSPLHAQDPDFRYATNRAVRSQATCQELTIIRGGHINNVTVFYRATNGTRQSLRFSPTLSIGCSSYAAFMNETCGPRCSIIYVLNADDRKSDADTDITAQLFVCENVVDQVTNPPSGADAVPYTLPDEQARILAGAIGYPGTYTPGRDYQPTSYPTYSMWSWDSSPMTENAMAQQIARFSIGAIAAIDGNRRSQTANGIEKFHVQTVRMKWKWVGIILTIVLGVQLFFLFFVMWFCHGVYIRDGSFLSNARLLRPIVEKLGSRGCAISGKEIAEMFKKMSIAYGVRLSNKLSSISNPFESDLDYERSDGDYAGEPPYLKHGEVMHLDLVSDNQEFLEAPMPGWEPGKHMPSGNYDGLETHPKKPLRWRG